MEEYENGKPPETALLTIEEHAERQGVSPSIFAAVTQFKNWAGGKSVSETEFKEAVNAFLTAPARGVRR